MDRQHRDLLRRIDAWMKCTGKTPTRFGREAVRDPRFVFDLRNGRRPRAATFRRVNAWLDREGAR